ncbi:MULTISPECIES: ATP-binding cassette domain-containing protein [unclassified Streptococcus]|uniref:ATP-binding cassette domain-containing protein n=1 Tax=unclassified Streptococcus TaxID=2608887 RepID=UPI00359EC758
MIELRQVSKSFEEKILFSKSDYYFERGKTYGIVGESGTGKTTLLNIIGKLESVDEGEVFVDGTPLKNIKEKVYFKDYVSYLFQNYGLMDNRTIKENLDLAFIGKKLDEAEKKQQMLRALQEVNLSLDLSRKIFSLSGGEAQRVAIAKTILKDSPILLADEPTASLDAKNAQEIIKLILGLKTTNRLIIIATHDPNVYNKMDVMINMDRG